MMSTVTLDLILAYSTMQLLFYFTQAHVNTTISPKEDYTVALDPNSVMQFNCTVTETDTIQWRVNDIPASDNDITSKGIVTTNIIETGKGVFMSMLFIPADTRNNNTSIQCRAYDLRSQPISTVDSMLLFFRVQGLLGSPPNTIISDSSESTRTLSWNAPETLDITDVDPDILSYRVCYNLTDNPTCIEISSSDTREFTFPNVGVFLLLTVSAINVVGEGNTSSSIHMACDSSEGIYYSKEHNYCIAGKFGGELNLVVGIATAELKSANISYLHIIYV